MAAKEPRSPFFKWASDANVVVPTPPRPPPPPTDGDAEAPPVTAAITATAPFVHPIPAWKRKYMVFVFALATILLFADQNLLAPNLSAAAEYFFPLPGGGFDEKKRDLYLGGFIQVGFFLIGAPAALIIGSLADRMNRRNLLVSIIIIGEVPCMCTYWVRTFPQFFALRLMTGISIGGCTPLVFSLLGDMFPPTQRAAVASLLQISMGLGIGLGQVLAGFIGPSEKVAASVPPNWAWKLPFLVVAAPAVFMAFVILLTTEDPPRGLFETTLQNLASSTGLEVSEKPSWAKVKLIFKSKTMWLLIVQGLFGCVPWGMMLTYINDFLSEDKGYSVETATLLVTLFGVAGGVGVVAGGVLGQVLYNIRKAYMPILNGVTAILAVGPVLYIINANLQALNLGLTIVMSAVGGILVSMCTPNIKALALSVNEPEVRGTAMAMLAVTEDVGKGMGPAIVSGIITQLGRVGAFNIAACFWVPCGVLLMAMMFTVKGDEAVMQARLALRQGSVRVPRPPRSGIFSFSRSNSVAGSEASRASTQRPRLAGLLGGGGGKGGGQQPSVTGGAATSRMAPNAAAVGGGSGAPAAAPAAAAAPYNGQGDSVSSIGDIRGLDAVLQHYQGRLPPHRETDGSDVSENPLYDEGEAEVETPSSVRRGAVGRSPYHRAGEASVDFTPDKSVDMEEATRNWVASQSQVAAAAAAARAGGSTTAPRPAAVAVQSPDCSPRVGNVSDELDSATASAFAATPLLGSAGPSSPGPNRRPNLGESTEEGTRPLHADTKGKAKLVPESHS